MSISEVAKNFWHVLLKSGVESRVDEHHSEMAGEWQLAVRTMVE